MCRIMQLGALGVADEDDEDVDKLARYSSVIFHLLISVQGLFK